MQTGHPAGGCAHNEHVGPALPAAAFRQAAALRQLLTNAGIDPALQAGPLETRAAGAAQRRPALRSRREQLPAVAARFYEAVDK